MNKKLAAKIQKLIPSLQEIENVFSSCLVIEPSEKELIIKKGCIYAVFDIESELPLNVSLITKVINDVLHDAYYQSDNISPIQSLEKAIVDVNDKVTNMPSGEGIQTEGKIQFNITASVLWGNVLYVVHFGNGKSFLMREGDIREVSTTSEGNFSVSSGVINNEDVIILNTVNFAKKYPPEKLLDSALSPKDFGPNQSCLILKFIIDTSFTDDEVIDFNLEPGKKPTKKLSGLFKKFKTNKTSKPKEKKSKDQTVQTIADFTSSKESQPKIKIKSNLDSKIKLIPLVIGLLVVSIVATIYLKKVNKEEPPTQPVDTPELTKQITPEEPKEPEETPEEVAEKEKKSKIERVGSEVFYDLKLTDENADPTDIVIFENTVVVTDAFSGKIHTSDLETPKFTPEETAFPGIKDAVNYEGKLNFADNEGYKVYDLVKSVVSESFTETLGITNTYFGNIYSISDTTLTKYVKSEDALESSVWAEGADFKNAKGMSISYSIYVLTENNGLAVFTQGEKSNFAISGLDKPLSNTTDVVTSTVYDYIYIADAGNNRVVMLNTDGEFIKQLKAENDESWSDIRSISVNADESSMFLLNGTKVYKIEIAPE